MAEDSGMDTTTRRLIEALLTKAEDPACTPQEAELFNGKAAQLMAKYGIDRALLDSEQPGTDRVLNKWYDFDPPYALDKIYLMVCIGDALRCRNVRTRGTNRLRLFGFASDIERVEILFGSLSLQAASGVRNAAVPRGVNTMSFRKSWLAGFSRAVGERLKAAENEASRDADAGQGRSTELVLLNRTTRVEDEFRKYHPKTTVSNRKLGPSGYDMGHHTGEKADLGYRNATLDSSHPRGIGQ